MSVSTQRRLGELGRLVSGRTWLPMVRLEALYYGCLAVEEQGIAGDVVECGTDRGGSAALMALAAPTRHLWIFDSFEGLPEPGLEDTEEAWEYVGHDATPVQEVVAFFAEVGLAGRYTLIPGWYEQTMPECSGAVERIAVLHLDCDWYASVKLCLEHLWDRVVPGGYIQIDDYGRWAGCRLAVDEFLSRQCPSAALHAIDYTARALSKP